MLLIIVLTAAGVARMARWASGNVIIPLRDRLVRHLDHLDAMLDQLALTAREQKDQFAKHIAILEGQEARLSAILRRGNSH